MADRKVSGDQGHHKEDWLWALISFGCVMLPVGMFPRNLGPIAVVFGLIFFGIPALIAGFILGNFFWFPASFQ